MHFLRRTNLKIKVGSRESKLAVIQSQMVIDCIKTHHPEIEIELVTMKTTGDIILDKTLDKIGGKGLFVKELDRALQDGKVDITVHSFKDMPMEVPKKLPIVAISSREMPNDVLILPKEATEIDLSKPIGCASARRTVQLKKIYPNASIKPVRGNVLTRLEKLDDGQYSALVLAFAGIKRLGLEHRISRIFSTKEIIPSACQGVIVVQARADFDVSFLDEFHDKTSEITAKAERAFVKTLDGGCSSPIASFAKVDANKLTLTGMYVDEKNEIFIKKVEDLTENAQKTGENLAKILLEEAK